MNFNDLYGNKALQETVKQLIANDTMPHAVLLSGMEGIGKFRFARAIAVEIAALHSDKKQEKIDESENLFEHLNIFYVIPTGVKGSGNNGVFNHDDYFKTIFSLKNEKNSYSNIIPLGYIQYIISQLKYKSVHDEDRIIIIRDAHYMTREAQNALLKILEEPPDRVFFILTTANEDKLLPTIISRCSRYLMSGLNENEMNRFLSNIGTDIRGKKLLTLLANGSPGILLKYSQFDVKSIADNLASALKKGKLIKLIDGIEKSIKLNKENKKIILKIYKEILLLMLYYDYIDNDNIFDYDLHLRKDRIERVLDKIIETEKNSIYNMSWETEWGVVFYNLIGG
ncbi:MAG: AAA family ATPase [Proteobacteria bacterium]|nr:AAA family ATPase [Pseudomonadota bacterium]